MSEVTRNCIYCEINGLTKDTGAHLYINTEKKVFYCQRCNESGKWLMTGSLPEQLKAKKDTYNNLELFNFDIKGNHPVANKVLDYITKRLPLDIIREKVRWSPTIERAFFPLWVNNRVVMWQGRAINKDVKPKYLTWGPCSKYLYGFEEAKTLAVLTEGPIDSLSVPMGVALFGKSISDTQFQMLTSKFEIIMWLLDEDTIGEKRIEEQKKKLKEFVRVIDVKMPKGKDANEVGMKAMKDLLWESYFINLGEDTYDFKRITERSP